MGKSTELQRLREAHEKRGDIVVEANLLKIVDYADFRHQVFGSPSWHRWVGNESETATLFVDSVDEGMIQAPKLVESLTADLRGYPVARLKVVLACRIAEWPVTAESEFFDLWKIDPQDRLVPELCPLRQVDARSAAESFEINADEFVEAAYRAQVAPMAARPLTLSFLLKEFQSGSVTDWSHRELYESAVRRLNAEHSLERASLTRRRSKTMAIPTEDERLMSAANLAAVMLLSGRSVVRLDGLLDDESFSRELVVEAAQSHVVETALFTGVGEGRFVFIHQTVAECLAALRLVQLPTVQLRRLLCRRDAGREHVAPQLAELAAWIAGGHADFLRHLLQIEPEILLRSDIARINGEFKRELVDAILAGARREEIFDDGQYRSFYKRLSHPGLAEQIHPVLRSRSDGIIARRVAFDIAEACQIPELCDDYFEVLRDSDESQQIREAAADALCASVPEERLAELIPLAEGTVGNDPQDSIRGDALARLVPTIWSVSDALPAIHALRANNYFGSYRRVLSDLLPRHVRTEDLVPLLRKCIEWTHCFDSLNCREELAGQAFAKALDHLDVPEIAALAVEVWLSKSRNYLPFATDSDRSVVGRALQNVEMRRVFAKCVLNDDRLQTKDIWHLASDRWAVLDANDIAWLVEGKGGQGKGGQCAKSN